MIILLTITLEHMEAALYETGPLLSYSQNEASLAQRGPLLSFSKNDANLTKSGAHLIVQDYHNLLATIAKLERAIKKGMKLRSVVALIGPVSFTRHRQTIALLNAFGAARNIPIAALEYTGAPPASHTITKTVKAISEATFQPLAPRYRARPTITISKKVPAVLKK